MVIGVFLDGKRIGSILDFPHQPRSRRWVAYGPGERSQAFSTRRAAMEWLRLLAEQGDAPGRPQG